MTAQSEKPQILTKKKKNQKLTLKQRRFLKEIPTAPDMKTAMIRAGYRDTNPVGTLIETLNNPNSPLKTEFQKVLEKHGLSDSYLADKFKKLSEAKEIKYFAEKGIVTDSREVEALETQRKTCEFVSRLKGHVIERFSVEVPGIEDVLEQIALRRKANHE